MQRPCDVCNTLFDPSTRNRGKGRQRYCSKKCRQQAHARAHWRRHHPQVDLRRLCVVCGVQFEADRLHPEAVTCSIKCNDARQNARRRRESAERYDLEPERECGECGGLFKPNKFALASAKYCSKACADKYRRRHAGRVRVRTYGGSYNKRLTAKRWQVARLAALRRDNRTCRACGERRERMSVHHLFDEDDHSLENLVTVCGPCHNAFHHFKLLKAGSQIVLDAPILRFLGVTKVAVLPS